MLKLGLDSFGLVNNKLTQPCIFFGFSLDLA